MLMDRGWPSRLTLPKAAPAGVASSLGRLGLGLGLTLPKAVPAGGASSLGRSAVWTMRSVKSTGGGSDRAMVPFARLSARRSSSWMYLWGREEGREEHLHAGGRRGGAALGSSGRTALTGTHRHSQALTGTHRHSGAFSGTLRTRRAVVGRRWSSRPRIAAVDTPRRSSCSPDSRSRGRRSRRRLPCR